MTCPFRSGFVSIVGKPNVGKSTLLNRLVGEKLAGVSRKPQTTRQVIRGIVTERAGQAIFLDTPGFHEPHDPLGEWMMSAIQRAVEGSDLVYWVVFPELPDALDQTLAGKFQKGTVPKGDSPLKGQVPIFLLVNQVDRVKKPKILPVLDAYRKLYPFQEILPISAVHGDNLSVLMQRTFQVLPENPAYFDADLLTDQNERTIVEEMIREKVFRFTGEEVPYSSAVEIEEFKEKSDQLVVVKAAVIVEKESQKAILIGKGGAKIKQIGENARKEIERFLGKKVFLELWVKAVKNWKKDPQVLKRLGYRD